jgi:hypothetical protein
LYQPQMMMVIVEQLVEWRIAGETEVLRENLPQCHFVHHKSHMTDPPRTWASTVGSQRLTARAMAPLVTWLKNTQRSTREASGFIIQNAW